MPQSNEQNRAPLSLQKTNPGIAEIKSRSELKAYFKNGRLPDETCFAHLIDSLVHQNDLWAKTSPTNGKGIGNQASVTHRVNALNRSWYVYIDSQNNLVVAESDAARVRINANDKVTFGGPDAPFALQVNGWTGIGMRIGTYNPTDDRRKEYPSSALARLQVPADGKWHPIITGLSGCHGFEVVASASGASNTRAHAITRAIAITSFSGRRGSLQQTQTYDGWYWRRKIQFKWKREDGGWFGRGTDYSLCVKTGCNFKKGDDGKPAAIRYHITRFW